MGGPGPSTSMLSGSTGGNIHESQLINSGHDTVYNVHNYYNSNNTGVSTVIHGVMNYVHAAAHSFIGWIRSANGKSHDPVKIDNIVPQDTSSLFVYSVADRYTRSMLECTAGYPLYEPHPFSEHSGEHYSPTGINVGDVGLVTKDGTFDFLFNICPQNNLINPSDLPVSFSLNTAQGSQTRSKRSYQPGTCIYPQNIKETESSEYICNGPDGAVLVLPDGAIETTAIHQGWFEDLAKNHGVEWYGYTKKTRGRSVQNGSLYLVTSFTKCAEWGIAVFDRPCDPGQGLTYVGGPLGWRGSKSVHHKVVDRNQEKSPNQCVFVRGYKIMLRQDIFDNLIQVTRQPATPIRGGGGGGGRISCCISKIKKIITCKCRRSSTRIKMFHVMGTNEVVPSKPSTPPVHPSDLVNIAILRQNPEVKIAVTHDDVWCDLLQDYPNFNEDKLKSIAQSYASTIDESGFSLKKSSDVANVVRFGDGEFTENQRNLIQFFIANETNQTVLSDINEERVLPQSITSLPHANAMFTDYRTKKNSEPCFEGTRLALLQEIANWVTNSGESQMYVLSGLAGVGKSTIAYTVASRAALLGLLGASFFFSRDEVDCNNARKFYTTIAYQLCVYEEKFAKAIGDALLTEHGSSAITKDPQEQLQVLILDPLRNIGHSRSRPILIVVDALNECNEEDRLLVLSGLTQIAKVLPSFKVILTTRPHPYLDRLLGSQVDYRIFHLQDVEENVVNRDIGAYLSHSLSPAQVQKHFPQQGWYASGGERSSLVRTAGGFFITPVTAVRYILDKSASNPAAQMQKLLRAITHDHAPSQALDNLYTIILRDVIPEGCDDDSIVGRYQSVVGAIVSAQHPLPVSMLSHLIDMDVEEIHAVLLQLQSVIFLGGDDVPRVYHLSFIEYVTDQARCNDSRLHIDLKIHHTQIVTRCFKIMDTYLKYNISDFSDPARFMANEDGLKADGITDELLKEKIPQQLRYTCIHWANHLEGANNEVTDLRNELENFVNERILYWLEVLSLIGKLDLARHAIRVVLKLLESSSLDLYQLLLDAQRFISTFYDIIKRSALHTYHSALPFTPTDSLLYRQYYQKEAHNICDVEGGSKNWNTLVADQSHGEGIDMIKFSLDSTLIASYSEELESGYTHKEGKLKIWDAATGTPVSIIPGHKFAVARDFSAVASSEDRTITIYDVNGSTKGVIFTTSSDIQRLALSKSSRVAVALSDGTVWLWNIRDAEIIDKFDGFEDGGQLKFSPTGVRLAYSSAKGILKLRDGNNGRFIANLQCGSVHNLEFSGDGSRIASLSRNSGLTLWDSESGALIGAIRNIWDWHVLAISPNGRLLATAHGNAHLALWNGTSDSLARIKVLELRDTRLMAFSLDNIFAIATDYDIKLYNIETDTFISTLSFTRAKPVVLAFSPDGTRLVCGSASGNMHLWDVRGIDASSPAPKEGSPVTALALSRDSSRLACGFGDGTVELWGTSSTRQRITFHRAHTQSVLTLEFGPDGGLFTSGSADGTIKLWNGVDGSLRGSFDVLFELQAVALSNSTLVAAYSGSVTLWSLDTLRSVHTFKISSNDMSMVSIAGDSTLIAVAGRHSTSLLDAVNYTIIATFNNPYEMIHTMTFLPDNSRLVVQSYDGQFLSYDLINKDMTEGPTLECLIQLSNTPLWRGAPVWHCQDKEQHYLSALFSHQKSPVPILFIPKDFAVNSWTQGLTMIALGCQDGRVILLRL